MIKKFLIIYLCSIMFTSLAIGQKSFTRPYLWLMKSVGTPQVSPNGKWAIFAVTEPTYDKKKVANDLGLVPNNGSTKPRHITRNKVGENAYCWRPDSKTIAFTAKRLADETAQIFLLPLLAGGEAQRLTNLNIGASVPQFSPDGRLLAFTRMVYPFGFADTTNKKLLPIEKTLSTKQGFIPATQYEIGINT